MSEESGTKNSELKNLLLSLGLIPLGWYFAAWMGEIILIAVISVDSGNYFFSGQTIFLSPYFRPLWYCCFVNWSV